MIEQQTTLNGKTGRMRKKAGPLILMVAGLLLVIAGLFWIANPGAATAMLESQMVEVVNDRPLHAVHEMEPYDPASIPFLPEGGPQPRISASETFYNFGSVGATEIVQHEFLIYNEGQAPLTISRAYTTCGCTTADISTTVIPPGKAAQVRLVFDAGFHAEAAGTTVRRGLILENNDPNSPEFEIWTQAAVRAKP